MKDPNNQSKLFFNLITPKLRSNGPKLSITRHAKRDNFRFRIKQKAGQGSVRATQYSPLQHALVVEIEYDNDDAA